MITLNVIVLLYIICFFSMFFCYIGNQIYEPLELNDIFYATMFGLFGPGLLIVILITIIRDLFFIK